MKNDLHKILKHHMEEKGIKVGLLASKLGVKCVNIAGPLSRDQLGWTRFCEICAETDFPYWEKQNLSLIAQRYDRDLDFSLDLENIKRRIATKVDAYNIAHGRASKDDVLDHVDERLTDTLQEHKNGGDAAMVLAMAQCVTGKHQSECLRDMMKGSIEEEMRKNGEASMPANGVHEIVAVVDKAVENGIKPVVIPVPEELPELIESVEANEELPFADVNEMYKEAAPEPSALDVLQAKVEQYETEYKGIDPAIEALQRQIEVLNERKHKLDASISALNVSIKIIKETDI